MDIATEEIMKLTQLSKWFERDSSYFNSVETQYPERFNFMMSFDEDSKESVRKYCLFVERTIERLQKEMFDNRKIFKVLLPQVGYTRKNISVAVNTFEQGLFALREDYLSVRFNVLKRYIELVKLLDKNKLDALGEPNAKMINLKIEVNR